VAAASPAAWRQLAGGVRRSPQAAMAGITLAIVAVLLLTLALSGGGRDLLPWTAFRLVMLGLMAIALVVVGLRRTALTYSLAGVLVAVAVTSIASVRLQSSVDQFIIWITYTATFLVVASTISNLKTARRFVDAAVFSGGALCLIGLYWFWGAGNPMTRWYSTFYWPNPFAGFLLLVLPVEVLRCILAGSRRAVLTHGAMSVLLGTAFVLTFSRGAWVAAAIAAGAAVTVLRTSLHRGAIVRAAALLIAVVAVVFIMTGGRAFRSPTAGVLARATSTADLTEYSLQGRLHFLRGAAEIFRDHPLVGTGPGTFTYVYPQYQRDVRFYSRDPHNLFAQMAAESGIVGLGALIWLMVAFVALGVRVVRRSIGTPEFPWIAGTVFGVGAFWLHTGMEMNWSFPAAPAMAFALMGVLAGYELLANPRHEMTATVRPEPVEGANGAQAEPVEWVNAESHRTEVRKSWTRWIRLAVALGIAFVMVVVSAQYAAAFLAGRWQTAAAFARASALNPLDPRYPSSLADALGKSGWSPAARIPLVQRARDLDRTNPYYWFQLALLTAQDPTPAAAAETERFLRTAIALDPFHYPEAYRHLAWLYRRRADPAAALEVYQQAAARYPDAVAQDFALRPRLWPEVVALFTDWAELLTEQRRDAEAEEIYARIVRLEPRFAPPYVGLVRLYVRAGRLRDAARVLEAGLAQLPHNAQLQALRRELQAMSPR